MFFNTINIHGHELQSSILKVKKQNDRILEIFKQINKPMTPLEAHRMYCSLWPPCPATSIRRGITQLTEASKLIKTQEQKLEEYGALNYYWKIV